MNILLIFFVSNSMGLERIMIFGIKYEYKIYVVDMLQFWVLE